MWTPVLLNVSGAPRVAPAARASPQLPSPPPCFDRVAGAAMWRGAGCAGVMLRAPVTLWHRIGVWTACSNVWHRTFGIRIEIRHCFSCDSSAKKQMWISAHWQPEFLFDDITCLGRKRGSTAGGGAASIPYTDHFAAGFECDSVSALNQSSALNHDCVSQRAGKTGVTAGGLVDYLESHHPATFFAENVKKLAASKAAGKSNLATLLCLTVFR